MSKLSLTLNIILMILIVTGNFLISRIWGQSDVKYYVLIPTTVTLYCFVHILLWIHYLEKKLSPITTYRKNRSYHDYIDTIIDESFERIESANHEEIVFENPHIVQYEICRILSYARESIQAIHLPQETVSGISKKAFAWYDMQEWKDANKQSALACNNGVKRIFIITEDVCSNKDYANNLYEIMTEQFKNNIDVYWVSISKLKTEMIKDYLIMDNAIILENIGSGMANFRIVWRKDVVTKYISHYLRLKALAQKYNKDVRKDEIFKL